MADEIVFTNEEQEFVDKIVQERLARQKNVYEGKLASQRDEILAEANREKLEEQKEFERLYKESSVKLAELEPLRGQMGNYEKYFETVLEERFAELGERAKKATKHLNSAFEKLSWLQANADLFDNAGDGVGSPRPASKKQKAEPERKYRLPSI